MPLRGSDLPNASAFLASVLPWPVHDGTAPGDPSFFINVHHRMPFTDRLTGLPVIRKGEQVQIYPGKGCITPNEAANRVAWCNSLDNDLGTDIYVCMSGQSEAVARLNSAGRKDYKAVRSSANAVAFKGLWIDVDVKPDPAKGYASSEEASNEFGRIRRAIGLPPATTLVWTGSGGFHAHWVFTDAVPVEIWEPLAHALVAALHQHGFRGDTGCTTDAARLLRVPDTWNHKAPRAGTGAKQPVAFLAPIGNLYLLDYIANILAPFKGVVPQRPARAITPAGLTGRPPTIQSNVDPASLGAGITGTPPASISQLAKVCPFVERTVLTGGKDNANPLWHATCRMAVFTLEGNMAAHLMADGYPSYTWDETQAQFERVQYESRQRDMGWPTCANIERQGAPECPSCPHFPERKAPFNFIELATAPMALVDTTLDTSLDPDPEPALDAILPDLLTQKALPPGYTYGKWGCVFYDRIDNEGLTFQEPVSLNYPMLDAWLQDQPAELNFTTTTEGELGSLDAVRRQIKIPFDQMREKGALYGVLARQHMVLPEHILGRFHQFMPSYIETLRANTNNLVQSIPYGWYLDKKGGLAGFIYAKRVWSAGKPEWASNPDPVIERQYIPTGTIEPWKIAAKLITDQHRPELDAILASAFGGPLVALVGQTGLFMSTYSPATGIGKTTALRVTQAVWADPIKAVQSLSDTTNSVINKLGVLKNLPVYWDELKTDNDTERFVQLVFQLAQGKERSRLTHDITFRDPGSWQTLLVSSSNDSLMSHITTMTRSTDAGVARIFEYEIMPGKDAQISNTTATQILNTLNTNYGNAGLIYAQWLGANHAQVAKEVDYALHELEKRYDVKPEERFWISLLTVIVMGAHYANQLGLTEIDEHHLYAFMVDNFYKLRAERATTTVNLTRTETILGHLSRYLNIKGTHNTIVTNVIWGSPGRPTGILLKISPQRRIEAVEVQFATDTKSCRILKAPFMEWLDQQKLSRQIVLKQLKEVLLFKETRGRLGAGTAHSTQLETVLDFSFDDPVFDNFIVVD